MDWLTLMKNTNTGTYSSQWMILDLNSFEASLGSTTLQPGTFYVAEQSTQRFLYKDFSTAISDGTVTNFLNLVFDLFFLQAPILGFVQHSLLFPGPW